MSNCESEFGISLICGFPTKNLGFRKTLVTYKRIELDGQNLLTGILQWCGSQNKSKYYYKLFKV